MITVNPGFYSRNSSCSFNTKSDLKAAEFIKSKFPLFIETATRLEKQRNIFLSNLERSASPNWNSTYKTKARISETSIQARNLKHQLPNQAKCVAAVQTDLCQYDSQGKKAFYEYTSKEIDHLRDKNGKLRKERDGRKHDLPPIIRKNWRNYCKITDKTLEIKKRYIQEKLGCKLLIE